MSEAAEILLTVFLEIKAMADTAQSNKRFAKEVANRLSQFEGSIASLQERVGQLSAHQLSVLQQFLELMQSFKAWFYNFCRKKKISQFMKAHSNADKLKEYTDLIAQYSNDLAFATQVEAAASLETLVQEQRNQSMQINSMMLMYKQTQLTGDQGQQEMVLQQLAELTESSKDELKTDIRENMAEMSAQLMAGQEQILQGGQATYQLLQQMQQQLNQKQVSKFASKINDATAAAFWDDYFPDDRTVSWSHFKEAFVHCFMNNEPMPRSFESIFRSKLDNDGDGYITNIEFSGFASSFDIANLDFQAEIDAAAQAELELQRTALVAAPKQRRNSAVAPPPVPEQKEAEAEVDMAATALGGFQLSAAGAAAAPGGDVTSTNLQGSVIPGSEAPEPVAGSSATTLDLQVFNQVFKRVTHRLLDIAFPTRPDVATLPLHKSSIRGGRRFQQQDTPGYFSGAWEGEHGSGVSRNHFNVAYDESKTGQYFLTDGGSLSGTWFRLSRGARAALREGVIFKIGQHEIRVVKAVYSGLMPATAPPAADVAGDFAAPWADVVGNDAQAQPGAPPRLVLQCIGVPGTPLMNTQWAIDAPQDNQEFMLGRHPQALVRINANGVDIDSQVSGIHGRILFQNGIFYLIDGCTAKGSSNGTWFRLNVGRGVVSPRPLQLSQGSQVMVGSVDMVFNVQEEGMSAEDELLATTVIG